MHSQLVYTDTPLLLPPLLLSTSNAIWFCFLRTSPYVLQSSHRLLSSFRRKSQICILVFPNANANAEIGASKQKAKDQRANRHNPKRRRMTNAEKRSVLFGIFGVLLHQERCCLLVGELHSFGDVGELNKLSVIAFLLLLLAIKV